jgi:hypothetical protein
MFTTPMLVCLTYVSGEGSSGSRNYGDWNRGSGWGGWGLALQGVVMPRKNEMQEIVQKGLQGRWMMVGRGIGGWGVFEVELG